MEVPEEKLFPPYPVWWVSDRLVPVAAFLVALPVGLLLGFLLAEVPLLGALFRPLVNFLFGVPKSIFLPVFILVFGVSIPQKIAFGVFTTVFVLITGGIAAVQSVPRELITVSRVYGASRGQIIREIYLPAMAPILLESARLAMVFNITARGRGVVGARAAFAATGFRAQTERLELRPRDAGRALRSRRSAARGPRA